MIQRLIVSERDPEMLRAAPRNLRTAHFWDILG